MMCLFVVQNSLKEKIMYRSKINRVIQLLALIALVTLGLQSAQAFGNSNGQPRLLCEPLRPLR
jgi:hypothetical protein